MYLLDLALWKRERDRMRTQGLTRLLRPYAIDRITFERVTLNDLEVVSVRYRTAGRKCSTEIRRSQKAGEGLLRGLHVAPCSPLPWLARPFEVTRT